MKLPKVHKRKTAVDINEYLTNMRLRVSIQTNNHIAECIEQYCHLLTLGERRLSNYMRCRLEGIEVGAVLIFKNLQPTQCLKEDGDHPFVREFYELCKKHNCAIQYTPSSGQKLVVMERSK